MTSESQFTGKTDAAGQNALESMMHIKPRQNFLTTDQIHALLFGTSGCSDAKLPEQIHKELEKMAKTWVE